jgi:hypothetical protein
MMMAVLELAPGIQRSEYCSGMCKMFFVLGWLIRRQHGMHVNSDRSLEAGNMCMCVGDDVELAAGAWWTPRLDVMPMEVVAVVTVVGSSYSSSIVSTKVAISIVKATVAVWGQWL